MKNKVLVSALIAGLLFQPMPVYSNNTAASAGLVDVMDEPSGGAVMHEFSFMYDDDEGDYYIAIGLHDTECTVPSEYKGKAARKLDLEHVYIPSYIPRYSFSTGSVVLTLPEGLEVVNKHWKGAVTGIPSIRLVYPSGETEELKADDYQEMIGFTKQILDEEEPFSPSRTDDEIEEKMISCLSLHEDNKDMKYPISENISYDESNLTTYGVIKSGDGYTYLRVSVAANEYMIPLPERYNGQKIDRIVLSDVVCPSFMDAPSEKFLTIIVPQSIIVSDTKWKDNFTGISTIELAYKSGEKHTYKAINRSVKPLSVYECELNWYPDVPGIELDKIYSSQSSGKVFIDGLILHAPEGSGVVSEHWLAKQTGILGIDVHYPSGEIVHYKSDDYSDYTKENYKTRSYNRAIGYSVTFFNNLGFTNTLLSDPGIWIVTPIKAIDDYSQLGDADKLLLSDLCSSEDPLTIDELRFPDTIKEIIMDNEAFKFINIQKLIIPDCSLTFKNETLSSAHIKEIVFEGDIALDHMLFYGNESIESITFKGKADFAYSALWGCNALKNININTDTLESGIPFNNCPNLMTINGVCPLNDDGSLKPEYEDFIRKYFYNTDQIGFINKYVSYCIKKIVSETVTDDMSDIEKVKALHDKLCSMTSYDFDDVKDPKNHVDASVFLNDSTVCEGYARTMNLLYHEAGIETCYVNTEDHAWVIVKLGEHYFHVDPTWDDGDTIVYDWFMKSDSQIDGKDSHTNWELKCPSVMHSFQTETMPECTEMMGDVDGNDIIDARDATAILTSYAKTSVGGKAEVDSILADFNFDGMTDARDASAVLTEYARSSVSQ